MTNNIAPKGRTRFLAGLTGETNRLTPSEANYAAHLGLRVFARWSPYEGRTVDRELRAVTKDTPRAIVLVDGMRLELDQVQQLWTPRHEPHALAETIEDLRKAYHE